MDHIHTYEQKKEKTFIHYRQRIGFSRDLRKKLNFLKSQRNNKKKLKKETDAALTYKKIVNYKKMDFW